MQAHVCSAGRFAVKGEPAAPRIAAWYADVDAGRISSWASLRSTFRRLQPTKNLN